MVVQLASVVSKLVFSLIVSFANNVNYKKGVLRCFYTVSLFEKCKYEKQLYLQTDVLQK